MSMDTCTSLSHGEGVPKERGTLGLVESLFARYSDEISLWSRLRYGRLGKRENEDVLGLDSFFLDTRRGEVHNIAIIKSGLQQLLTRRWNCLTPCGYWCLSNASAKPAFTSFKALTSSCASNPSKLYIYVSHEIPSASYRRDWRTIKLSA